jgi:hypothetical protein
MEEISTLSSYTSSNLDNSFNDSTHSASSRGSSKISLHQSLSDTKSRKRLKVLSVLGKGS